MAQKLLFTGYAVLRVSSGNTPPLGWYLTNLLILDDFSMMEYINKQAECSGFVIVSPTDHVGPVTAVIKL